MDYLLIINFTLYNFYLIFAPEYLQLLTMLLTLKKISVNYKWNLYYNECHPNFIKS